MKPGKTLLVAGLLIATSVVDRGGSAEERVFQPTAEEVEAAVASAEALAKAADRPTP